MVPAPVGFRCPECVAGAAAQVRQPTTVAGGAIIAKPMVTYSLIGINVAVFLVRLVGINAVAGRLGDVAGRHCDERRMVAPGQRGIPPRIVPAHRVQHVCALRAGTNARGASSATTATCCCTSWLRIGGGVASYLFSDVRTVSVGASETIFELMGALVVAGRRLRYDVTQVLVLLKSTW